MHWNLQPKIEEQLLRDFYNIFKEETGSNKILKEVSIHHNYAAIENILEKKL